MSSSSPANMEPIKNENISETIKLLTRDRLEWLDKKWLELSESYKKGDQVKVTLRELTEASYSNTHRYIDSFKLACEQFRDRVLLYDNQILGSPAWNPNNKTGVYIDTNYSLDMKNLIAEFMKSSNSIIECVESHIHDDDTIAKFIWRYEGIKNMLEKLTIEAKERAILNAYTQLSGTTNKHKESKCTVM